ILYAAPVWAEAAKTKSYVKGVKGTYRLCALRVCSGFRTISDDAALAIAGMVPIDLLATEAKVVYEALILSGHGCFRSYLYRFGHDEDPRCPRCGIEETAEHIVLSCPRFTGARDEFLGGMTTAELLGRRMIEDADAWSNVCSFAVTAMKELRRLERQRAVAR
ncbi:hypothetical protein KR067_008492, partial [Drosophila pandora]